MIYEVEYSDRAIRELKKLDKQTARVIKNWINKNLVETSNPRRHGKALTGNLSGFWRYRVGDYRIIAKIEDNKLLIFIFEVAHRREIYKG